MLQLTVTVPPPATLDGVAVRVVAAADTVKLPLLVPVPTDVVTEIGPVVAAAGTVAVILVAELTVKPALVPLNLTAVTPAKLLPLIVTLVPTGPLVGVNEVIVGAGAAVTDAVGSEVADVEPPVFVAVTTTRTVRPTSAATSR